MISYQFWGDEVASEATRRLPGFSDSCSHEWPLQVFLDSWNHFDSGAGMFPAIAKMLLYIKLYHSWITDDNWLEPKDTVSKMISK